MIERVREQAGQKEQEVLADSGYCSEENLRRAAKKKVDLYVATGKQKHNQLAQASPRGRIPKSTTLVQRMKRKLTTRAGQAIYARRKTIVEPVFGQIKQAQDFRRFLLRGVEKVRSEWALVCATHNVLKLYRACTALKEPASRRPRAKPSPASPQAAASTTYTRQCPSGEFLGMIPKNLTQTRS
jgi:hypothetical protein